MISRKCLVVSHILFGNILKSCNITNQFRCLQEAAALAATQVAFVLQSGQRRGLQFMIAPHSPTSAAQEAV